MKRLRILSGLLTLVAVGVTVYFCAPVRLMAIVLAGRSPDCPLDRALASAGNLKRQIELKDRILAASRRIETDEKGFMLWHTPHGPFWIPKDNQFVLPFNLAEQERGIYSLDSVRIRPGDVVLDCGANVGVYTREALNQGAGRVVSIEPAPENIECLRRNFAAEIASGKVIVYPKGLWDSETELTLHVDPHNSAADSFLIERDGSHAETRIPVTTIDKLVAELNLDRVDFVKMDIEGAEPRALRGGRSSIARFRPRMALSVYHAPDHPVVVPREVRTAWDGYRLTCGPCAEANWRIRPDVFFFF